MQRAERPCPSPSSSESKDEREKKEWKRCKLYLKSLILHRRYKKYDKRSFDSVPILESVSIKVANQFPLQGARGLVQLLTSLMPMETSSLDQLFIISQI